MDPQHVCAAATAHTADPVLLEQPKNVQHLGHFAAEGARRSLPAFHPSQPRTIELHGLRPSRMIGAPVIGPDGGTCAAHAVAYRNLGGPPLFGCMHAIW